MFLNLSIGFKKPRLDYFCYPSDIYNNPEVEIMTVTDSIEQLNNFLLVGRTRATYEYYQFSFQRIAKHFGKYELEKVDKTVILDLITKIKKESPTISNNTLNKFIGAVKSLIRFSLEK